jgi:heme exporter protein B
MSYFADVAALARKDLLIEMRAKETLPAMLLFVLSALTVMHFAVPQGAELVRELAQLVDPAPAAEFRDFERLATLGLLWVALVFTALLGLTRAFVPEREQQTMDALVLATRDRSAIWLAKSLAVFAFLAVVELIALPAFSLFFDPVGARTVAAVALANVGICAVGTLTGAMAAAGRARELILPLLFLPLAIPVVVGGVGASTGAGGKYLAFLALYDAIFALLAWASFEYVVAET